MSTSRRYRSTEELRKRIQTMREEIRLDEEELARRESAGDVNSSQWKDTGTPRILLVPRNISHREEEEEEKRKGGNEANKALMRLAKEQIEAGITSVILQEKRKEVATQQEHE